MLHFSGETHKKIQKVQKCKPHIIKSGLPGPEQGEWKKNRGFPTKPEEKLGFARKPEVSI